MSASGMAAAHRGPVNAEDLRSLARAAQVSGPQPPPEDVGDLLSECHIGGGRVLKFIMQASHRRNRGDWPHIIVRTWQDGVPTRAVVRFRLDRIADVALGLAEAMERAAAAAPAAGRRPERSHWLKDEDR